MREIYARVAAARIGCDDAYALVWRMQGKRDHAGLTDALIDQGLCREELAAAELALREYERLRAGKSVTVS